MIGTVPFFAVMCGGVTHQAVEFRDFNELDNRDQYMQWVKTLPPEEQDRKLREMWKLPAFAVPVAESFSQPTFPICGECCFESAVAATPKIGLVGRPAPAPLPVEHWAAVAESKPAETALPPFLRKTAHLAYHCETHAEFTGEFPGSPLDPQ